MKYENVNYKTECRDNTRLVNLPGLTRRMNESIPQITAPLIPMKAITPITEPTIAPVILSLFPSTRKIWFMKGNQQLNVWLPTEC